VSSDTPDGTFCVLGAQAAISKSTVSSVCQQVKDE
jgi:hypothetical protein